ncbi:MAG TPA: response regulator [Patescibacteria group bacterium]|nr:response regulator [Patescibacteria group bacterium]
MAEEKKIVLVVEDEVPMLQVLRDKLRESGFATFQARDGEEGLSLALAHHPDVILLDLLMPKMDGMTMMSKLRQDVWGKKVPVIILTNVSADTDATIKAIIAYQPAYYLVKSDVKLDGIVEKIQSVLSKKDK